MAETCSECGQVVSKASTLQELYSAIKKDWNWYAWGSEQVGTYRVVPNVGRVELVDKSDNINEDPEYSTLDIYMVFFINDLNVHVRLNGELSSYEGHNWESWFTKVNKQKREIWVYE